jgi:energy-converting hydrogenase Eha subunit G
VGIIIVTLGTSPVVAVGEGVAFVTVTVGVVFTGFVGGVVTGTGVLLDTFTVGVVFTGVAVGDVVTVISGVGVVVVLVTFSPLTGTGTKNSAVTRKRMRYTEVFFTIGSPLRYIPGV